jgi:serine protease AprX
MTLRICVRSLVALVALALSATPSAAQKSQKLDLALRQSLEQGTASQRVIISVKPGMRPLLRSALKRHGDKVVVEHPSIEALTAFVHGEDLLALSNDPAVVAVSIDAPVTASGAKGAQHGRVTSRALKYYSGLRAQLGLSGSVLSGAGIGVAIIDSGIAPVSDFGLRITNFVDFTKTNTPVPVAPYDDFGHGTHVAGLVGGTGWQSGYSYMGVAPKARLIGVKVLDGQGTGRTSNVIAAIDYVVANAGYLGVDVINLALGHPIFENAETDPLVRAVERAVRHGLVVVTSTGNYGDSPKDHQVGYAGVTSPGNAPSAITVGALATLSTIPRDDDYVPDYSSRGPTWYDAFAKPEIVAPGHRLISDCVPGQTLSNEHPTLRVPGRQRGACYIALSGTSMSAAVTSGSVAVLLEQSRLVNQGGPKLTPNAVKAILQYTAIPVVQKQGELYDGLTQGTGGLNMEGAVRLAAAIDTSMPVNVPWVAAAPEALSVIGGSEYTWSRNIVWGGRLVSSDSVLYVNSLAWGDNIVWGTAVDGDNIVWGTARDGDNIVWGTAAEWGDNIVWGTNLLRTADGDNIVWGTIRDGDNIVWGTIRDGDNIVWGTRHGDIAWGAAADVGDNIVWGGRDQGDNIVWGTRSAPAKKLK